LNYRGWTAFALWLIAKNMTGIEPIIYFISAVTAEAVKDVSKHIGKKAKEFYDNLHEDIIKLEIDKADNNEVIQQKLDTKPEIKANIEQKVLENQDVFAELLKVLKEKSNKNVAKVENTGIIGSNVTTNVYQGDKNTSTTQHFIWAGVAVVAIVGIVGIVLGLNVFSKPSTENSSVNSISNSIVNSTLNLQPTVTPINTNIIANQPVIKPTVDKQKPTTTIKPSPTPVKTPKKTAKPKTVIVNQNGVKPTSKPTPSDCSSTPEGCKKEKN
jgi:hypothetical protein